MLITLTCEEISEEACLVMDIMVVLVIEDLMVEDVFFIIHILEDLLMVLQILEDMAEDNRCNF